MEEKSKTEDTINSNMFKLNDVTPAEESFSKEAGSSEEKEIRFEFSQHNQDEQTPLVSVTWRICGRCKRFLSSTTWKSQWKTSYLRRLIYICRTGYLQDLKIINGVSAPHYIFSQYCLTVFIPTLLSLEPQYLLGPDGGWGWVVCAASFVVNFIVDGTSFSFGILLKELLQEFRESEYVTSWAGSALLGFSMMMGPLVSQLLKRFTIRQITLVGTLISSTGFIASAFAPNIYVFIFTYGVISGTGLSMIFLPSIIIVGFYFQKKRAFATGISTSGSGCGIFAYAYLNDQLLRYYNWRQTVLILAGILLNCLVCGMVFWPLDSLRRHQKGKSRLVANSQSDRVSPSCFAKLISMCSGRKIRKGDKHAMSKKNRSTLNDGMPCDSLEEGMSLVFKEETNKSNVDVSYRHSHSVGEVSHYLLKREDFVSCSYEMLLLQFRYPTADSPQRRQHLRLHHHCATPHYNRCLVRHVTQKMGNRLSKSDENVQGQYEENAGSKLNRVKYFSETHLAPRNSETHLAPPISETQPNTSEFNSANKCVSYSSHQSPESYWLKNICCQLRLKGASDNYRCSKTIAPSGTRLREAADCSDVGLQSEDNSCSAPLSCHKCCQRLLHLLGLGLLKHPKFIFLLITFITWTAQAVPLTYLPNLAISKGVTHGEAAFLLSIIGITNIVGRVAAGAIVYALKVRSIWLYVVALLVAALVNFSMPWCQGFALLAVVAALFGMCMAFSVSLRTVVLAEQLGIEALTDSFGVVSLFQGLAFIVITPLAGKLFDETGLYILPFTMSGSMYVISYLSSLVVALCFKRDFPLSQKIVMEEIVIDNPNINISTA